jgi:type I restriction enzyme S subunit
MAGIGRDNPALKGVLGSVYFVPSDYWPHDTTLWVTDFHGNDRRFVDYFFKWMAPRIATMGVDSANPTLNRSHVHPLEMSRPPPDNSAPLPTFSARSSALTSCAGSD